MIVRVVNQSPRIPAPAGTGVPGVKLDEFSLRRDIHAVPAAADVVIIKAAREEEGGVVVPDDRFVRNVLCLRERVDRRAGDKSHLRDADVDREIEKAVRLFGRADVIPEQKAVEHENVLERYGADDLFQLVPGRHVRAAEELFVHPVVVMVAAQMDRFDVLQIPDLMQISQPEPVRADRDLDLIAEHFVKKVHDLVEEYDVEHGLAARELDPADPVLSLQQSHRSLERGKIQPAPRLRSPRDAERAVRRAKGGRAYGQLQADRLLLVRIADPVRRTDVAFDPNGLAEDLDEARFSAVLTGST